MWNVEHYVLWKDKTWTVERRTVTALSETEAATYARRSLSLGLEGNPAFECIGPLYSVNWQSTN